MVDDILNTYFITLFLSNIRDMKAYFIVITHLWLKSLQILLTIIAVRFHSNIISITLSTFLPVVHLICQPRWAHDRGQLHELYSISLLLPRLPKLPWLFEYHWLGNLVSLVGSKGMQTHSDCGTSLKLSWQSWVKSLEFVCVGCLWCGMNPIMW